MRWSFRVAASAVVVVGFVLLVLTELGVFDFDVWHRDQPLAGAVMVSGVQRGAVTLADGRVFRPAGVRRAEGVDEGAYDRAIGVVCAQGVVVRRDLGDGRAFLVAEPRFFNWCGTRNYNGNPRARWGGSYIQCPVSELLVKCGYAVAVVDEAGLTSRERWRLEGVARAVGVAESPKIVSEKQSALMFDAGVRLFDGYDATLELMWKPPPGEDGQ